MLDLMRRHQQSFLIYLVFGAIIVVFAINFGPGSGSCGGFGGNYAAIVDGDVIAQDEFSLNYSRRIEYMRRSMRGGGSDFTDEMARQMGLRTQVIDQLINSRLLSQEAERWDLTVADDELLEYLETNYGVGDVNFEQYEAWVQRNFRVTVPRFEERARHEILGQKIAKVLEHNLSISDAELRTQYEKEHDQAMVHFVRFDPVGEKVEDPTDAAIEELLSSDAEAIEKRFESDKFRYRTPEQRRARQIVIQLAQDASDADQAKARGKLLEAKSQIEGGADFASLVKELSEDPTSKDKGGDMGFVQRGQMARAVEDALFALAENEVSDPVRSPLGLHLMQQQEIKPAGMKELEEVRKEVATSILHDRAGDAKSKAKAEAFLAKLTDGGKLEELTVTEEESRDQPDRPVRHETPWIQKTQENISRIGTSKELRKAIFASTKEEPLLKQAYKVGRSFFVVQLKDRETPDLEKFEADKDKLRDQALWGKRSRVQQSWLKHLREQADVRLNPELFGAPGSS